MRCPHLGRFDNIINLETNTHEIGTPPSLINKAQSIQINGKRDGIMMLGDLLINSSFNQNYQPMDSSKLLRYTYRPSTEPSQRNMAYTKQFEEYSRMLNRLNFQNQSLSVNMMGLINQNKQLKKQLHQKRIEEIKKQPQSELKAHTRYLTLYHKPCNKTTNMNGGESRRNQGESRVKNNSVYVPENKNKQAKVSSVLKTTTMIEELSQQKFAGERKKGLYLSKQISQASQDKKPPNVQPADQAEKKEDNQANPESPQKQTEQHNNKNQSPKNIPSISKKTNQPYRVPMVKVKYDSTASYSQLRKDHLESMYSYLYSPIKTYNHISHDKS